MNRKVGDKVRTRWDDTKRLLSGVIVDKYRGHRAVVYLVKMSDGSVEQVSADQFV